MKVIYEYDVVVGDSCGERFARRSDARKAKAKYKASGSTDVRIVQRKFVLQEAKEIR